MHYNIVRQGVMDAGCNMNVKSFLSLDNGHPQLLKCSGEPNRDLPCKARVRCARQENTRLSQMNPCVFHAQAHGALHEVHEE